MKKYLSTIFHPGVTSILLCILITSACGRYRVSLNNQELYEPPQLAKISQIEDINFKNCINQTLADNQVTSLEKLARLSCTYAGIASLEGLEQLTGLTELNLSDNNLQDILPVFNLQQLKTLHLSNNPELKCAQLKLLRGNSQIEISINPPSHCEDK